MSERYTKLFSLPIDLYAEGSPVIISAGNLLNDNQTGKVLAQLKIKSVYQNNIKALWILVHALDPAGMPLEGDAKKEYLDLNIKRGEEFGQKVPVPLPDASTRGFTVEVTKAVFSDNSIWSGTNAPWSPLPTPENLAQNLCDEELVKQFQIQYGGPCRVLPQKHRDLWLCTCGTWNKGPNCYVCGKDDHPQLSFDLDALAADKDARLAQEKADQEAKATTEKAKRRADAIAAKAAAEAKDKKMKKAIVVLIFIAVVFLVSAAVLLIKMIFG